MSSNLVMSNRSVNYILLEPPSPQDGIMKSMNWKLFGEVAYRLFASLILVAIEVAVYLVVLATSINAARDIYEADCAKQAIQCGTFPLAAQAQLIFIGILTVTLVLLVLYTLWPLTQNKRTAAARKAATPPVEPQEVIDEDDDL